MDAVRIDELLIGARVARVEPKLRFQSEEQATRKGVAAWRLHVSLGDDLRRSVIAVTVWQPTEPEVAAGQLVRFSDVTVGASEKGRIWVTAASWAAAK